MKRALGVVALLLLAIAAYLAVRPRASELSLETAPRSSLKRRDRELELLPTQPDASLRSSVAAGEEPEAAPAQTNSSPTDAAQTFDVRVTLLSRKERSPMAALPVKLTWWHAEENTPGAQGTTDATGSALLRLATGGVARELLCDLSVGEGETAQQFSALPLKDELVVLLDPCTRLHGILVLSGAELTENAWVVAFEPASGMMSTHVRFARARVQLDGSFEMQACPSREIPSVGLNIQISTPLPSLLDLTSTAKPDKQTLVKVLRKIAWEELSSEAGARIELRLCELTVRVLDPAGAPIAGAAVRVSRLAADAPFPSAGRSDEQGEFRATLEPAECEVIVGALGLASVTERVELRAEEFQHLLELRLRPLNDNDRLHGRVVREDRSPIEDALVTAYPTAISREGAGAALVQARTDSYGRFDLAIATDRELEVVAFRRDLGFSDEVRFVPDGRELELVIRAQGSLEVRVALPAGFSAFANGSVEYALVDRDFDLVDHGHEFQVPFTLDEVPAGNYNLFVFVAGWNAYAEGSVHVTPGNNRSDARESVELYSHIAQFARGTALTKAGLPAVGARIELDHPTWPPEVERLWSVKVGDDGRFEVLLGVETACSARVTCAGKPDQRVELHAGDGAVLRLP